MPPIRNGRASKACTACRKQKTRCYDTESSGGACLRCETLGQPCSLQEQFFLRDDGTPTPYRIKSNPLDVERLSRLEHTVSALIERLGAEDVPRWTSSDASPSRPLSVQRELPLPSAVPSTAPVFLIRQVATELGVHPQDRTATNSPARGIPHNIISNGLISHQDASYLLTIFHEHYGRWVSFNPSMSTELLLAEVGKSPLLLCACCLIAVRHTTQELASKLAPRLFREAKSLLSTTLLAVPQSIQFFQAALILSLWSTTIGQAPLSIDSWLLSGFALQHSLASNLFDAVMNTTRRSFNSKIELDRWCVWNHLCLAHLHYCVGTRRKAILDRTQIDRCREILNSDHATNFESRMVAEVNLYWIIYERCSTPSVDLPGAQAALRAWKQKWGFLFDQPRSQFMQMGFHFAQLLIYDQSLKSRSAAVRESLLSEMARLSAAILTLAMETADDRTRHLTDHIYHMITFAAVTICRLLHMYEDQLAPSHDIAAFDALILQLVGWLHSIGLPCHIAHTLGDVVAAFHKKLRPDAYSTAPTPDQSLEADFALLFPELLGLESFEGGSVDLLPDWEPFISATSS